MADTPATSSDCMEKFKSYVTTPKGLVLAAEIVLCLTVNICYAASVFHHICYVAVAGMIFGIIFFCVFMMELDKHIIWVWRDLFRTVIKAPWFMIESLYRLSLWPGDGPWVAGGIFGLIAGLVFAYDVYTICLQIKSARQDADRAALTGEITSLIFIVFLNTHYLSTCMFLFVLQNLKFKYSFL
uniref:Proteolipid protein 2 n=1 Tax=Neogobius melanostomus TaxID=47308 RepID=A0A8C6WIP5_9GOBI